MPDILHSTGELLEPLPFSAPEYERRSAALRDAMAAEGIDAFIAFGPKNINYLTGHDTPAYQYLQACVVAGDGVPVNLVRSIDASNTLLRSWSRRVVAYADHDDPVATLVALVRQLVPPGARIGAEDRAFFVSPRRYQRLAEALGAAGYALVGSQLVDRLRLIKSGEELAKIRAAGAITARAMQAAVGVAAEGESENRVAAAVWSSLVLDGGEFPGLPPFISAVRARASATQPGAAAASSPGMRSTSKNSGRRRPLRGAAVSNRQRRTRPRRRCGRSRPGASPRSSSCSRRCGRGSASRICTGGTWRTSPGAASRSVIAPAIRSASAMRPTGRGGDAVDHGWRDARAGRGNGLSSRARHLPSGQGRRGDLRDRGGDGRRGRADHRLSAADLRRVNIRPPAPRARAGRGCGSRRSGCWRGGRRWSSGRRRPGPA